MNRFSITFLSLLCLFTVVLLSGCKSTPSSDLPRQISTGINELRLGKVYADRIKPGKEGGCSLQCVYRLEAPYPEVWKLKTQFENLTGTSGPITECRIITRTPDKIVYEAKGPQLSKWLRTEINLNPKTLTITITLLNPDEMGMIFMNSEIKLKPDGRGTIVYWRNNLSLRFWPDTVASSLMLPKMKETAIEDCRLFRQIMKTRIYKRHPNYINPRI
jgi:hypothetical protein